MLAEFIDENAERLRYAFERFGRRPSLHFGPLDTIPSFSAHASASGGFVDRERDRQPKPLHVPSDPRRRLILGVDRLSRPAADVPFVLFGRHDLQSL